MDTFTARTPVDLLAVVPYLIGFHPDDSVVMLTLADAATPTSPTRPECFHVRVDLPVVEHEQRAVAALLRDVAGRHQVAAVGLVLYTDDAAAARCFAALAVPALLAAGIEVVDVLRADGERYFAADDPESPGTPYDLAAHPYTTAAVVAGRVAHESRDALADSLVGTDSEDADAVGAAAAEVVDELLVAGRAGRSLTRLLSGQARWLRDVIGCCLDWDAPPTAADAGRMLVLVSFEALREVAWAEMTRRNAGLHVDLWRGLVRRAPEDLRSGVAALLGFSAWLAGDGALAWCALDRCFEGDPDDQLGQYVASLVDSATPPTVWAPIPVASLRIFRADGGAVAAADVPLLSSYGAGRGPAGVQPG